MPNFEGAQKLELVEISEISETFFVFFSAARVSPLEVQGKLAFSDACVHPVDIS